MRQVSPSCFYYNDGHVNAGAIVTGAGPVFIDSMNGPAQAMTFHEEVRVVTPHSARYLITTHEHLDHNLGNQVFKCDIVAARPCYERLAKPPEPDDRLPEGVQLVAPNIRFDGQLDLELAGRLITVTHSGGHSPGSSYVWLADEGVLFAGDLVFEGRTPYVHEADIPRWIAILRELRKLPINTVVPGHGDAKGPEVLDTQAGWLMRFMESVKAMAGRPIDEIVAAITADFSIPERQGWTIPLAVRRIIAAQ